MRSLRRSLGGIVGILVALVAWLLVVPWDLSEVDASGRPLSTGGDDHFAAIGLVYLLVVALGALLAVRNGRWVAATGFVFGACLTWVALFAWRAGAARTVGANMFILPLAFLVIPAAAVAVFAVTIIARSSDRGPASSRDG
jgi:hypothetical protein